jgi:hypothetical protein
MDAMLKKTKRIGIELLARAIKEITSGEAKSFYAQGEGSYHSFPTRESYLNFKRLGYKLW